MDTDERPASAEYLDAARKEEVRYASFDDIRVDLEHMWGLALSGGGIRSATFNLAVVPGLWKVGRLSRFDYLSTGSGGGFIGGWMTSQIHRQFGGHVKAFESALSSGAMDGDLAHLLQHRNYLMGPEANATYEAW